jgi:hypothetical protein
VFVVTHQPPIRWPHSNCATRPASAPGTRVDVPGDTDPHTWLLALIGRGPTTAPLQR